MTSFTYNSSSCTFITSQDELTLGTHTVSAFNLIGFDGGGEGGGEGPPREPRAGTYDTVFSCTKGASLPVLLDGDFAVFM